MKKINIKNLENTITHTGTFSSEELCLQWVDSVKSTGSFGKLEREVEETSPGVLANNEDITKSISFKKQEISSDNIKTLHTLPQEFSFEVIDISKELEAQQESEKALKYLVETDWMISRKVETGKELPEEVKKARAEARLKVL